MKSKKISKFKIGMFSGLLAVVLLLVGFWIVAPKATRASADMYGGTLTYDNGVFTYTMNFFGVGVSSWAYYREGNFTNAADIKSGGVAFGEVYNNNPSHGVHGFSFTLPLVKGKVYSVVTYTLGHGSGSLDPSNIVLITPPPVIPLPQTPTKEGHTFVGWYLDEACTIAYAGQEITADMTFYAGWTINTYTVTFNSNGGSAVENQTLNWNTTATLTTPTRVGYNFIGWCLPSGLPYENQPIASDLALVAKWEIKTFTVTFMVDGEQYNSVVVPYGATFEQAMKVAKMSYFNLIVDGVKDGKSGVITENITAVAAAMTDTEKVATFLANNSWILWGALIAITGLTITLVIVIKKR